MSDEEKNCWPTNNFKWEIWPVEEKGLRTPGLVEPPGINQSKGVKGNLWNRLIKIVH